MKKKLPKLSPSQKELLQLLCKAVNENDVVSKSRLFSLYKGHARGESERYVRNFDAKEGEPEAHWIDVPWDEYEWQRNFSNWFVYSLGSLLRKGYLKVVPAINMEEIE